jgi:hypothetical protein
MNESPGLSNPESKEAFVSVPVTVRVIFPLLTHFTVVPEITVIVFTVMSLSIIETFTSGSGVGVSEGAPEEPPPDPLDLDDPVIGTALCGIAVWPEAGSDSSDAPFSLVFVISMISGETNAPPATTGSTPTVRF